MMSIMLSVGPLTGTHRVMMDIIENIDREAFHVAVTHKPALRKWEKEDLETFRRRDVEMIALKGCRVLGAGDLFELMKIFSSRNINLVKLESRPIPGKPWEYMFYADIEADILSRDLAPVLEELKAKSETLKILGRY